MRCGVIDAGMVQLCCFGPTAPVPLHPNYYPRKKKARKYNSKANFPYSLHYLKLCCAHCLYHICRVSTAADLCTWDKPQFGEVSSGSSDAARCDAPNAMQLNGAVSRRAAPAVADHQSCVAAHLGATAGRSHGLRRTCSPTTWGAQLPRRPSTEQRSSHGLVSRNSKLDDGKRLVNWGKGHEAKK